MIELLLKLVGCPGNFWAAYVTILYSGNSGELTYDYLMNHESSYCWMPMNRESQMCDDLWTREEEEHLSFMLERLSLNTITVIYIL
jgi:hypothetical protein